MSVTEWFGEWEKVLSFSEEIELLPKLIIQTLLTHSDSFQMHYL